MFHRSVTLFACFVALASPVRAQAPQAQAIELRLLAFQPDMSNSAPSTT